MTYYPQHYELITLITTCSCGAVYPSHELLEIIKSGSTFSWHLVKPSEPVYDLEVRRETRTERTRACLACIETTARTSVERFRPNDVYQLRPKPAPIGKPSAIINLEELDLD